MERRKSLIEILRPTNPKTWHKNTIILLLAIFYIFAQAYELEYRTKEIRSNLSAHRLDNTEFYKYIPVDVANQANYYLVAREDQIVDNSIHEYQKRIAIEAIFFLFILILSNTDLRKKDVKLRLKRYKRALAHK